MIDTDKYEGHTPAPWEEIDFDWETRTSPNGAQIITNDYVVCIEGVADAVFVNDGGTMDANWNLITDAPLLLQEVKRLRARIEQAIATLRSQPNDLEDGPDYHRELLSFLDGTICHAIDVLEGKE